MDLFELLIIAAFVLIPILEGIMKQRRKTSEGPPPGEDEAATGPGRAEEPRPAADMVPDDLWQILTGERRTPGPEPTGAPWSLEPAGSEQEAGGEPVAVDTADDWGPEPWGVEEEAALEPISLEYRGPEAYSLETPPPPARSLERPLPTPEERHDAFRDRIDRPRRAPDRRGSTLVRALRDPAGLRQAVLMKEILGPPRGLE